MKTPLVRCKNLTKTFGKSTIIDNIDLEIPKGRVIGLLGRNGAGKSTLMKLIMGLLVPASGKILFKGQPLGASSNKLISFLPDSAYLDKTKTIKQTINFFVDFYDNFDPKKASKLISVLKLDESAELKSLSKGMLEKAELVLTISREADLYMLDEPIGGVDPATRDAILDLILKNTNKNATILISTHIISDIEKVLDDVIIIDRGKIILTEEAKKLRKRTGKTIDEFFREEFKDVLETI